MGFLAVLFALILEQARPLARGNWVHSSFRTWARWSNRTLDAGQPQHGWIAWCAAVFVPSMLTMAIHLLLWQFSVLLAFAWSIGILYTTLGFRQFSHYFTDIRDALEGGDEDAARDLLAHWRQVDARELPRSEIVRHVIEHSVLASHRHVFGVLGWFSFTAALGLGPAGAVMYRMSEFVSRYWIYKSLHTNFIDDGASPALQAVALRAWGWIDYIPARITALGFAVVGSFEDAIDAWRSYTQSFDVESSAVTNSRNDGLLLAATSGAVNVRLGGDVLRPVFAERATQTSLLASDMETPTVTAFTSGQEPELAHLRSIVGLVWRSVVLWMVLLALLTLARLLG